MGEKRPNLIYVFADQWRRQAVGFMNEDPVRTPHMDRFAQEGLVFDQAVSCTPLCSPHRASLLSARYAHTHGVYTNCKIGSDIMLSPDEICIGNVLKQAGYSTGYIGKWHLDLPEQNVVAEPASGARDWDAFTPPGPKRQGFDYWYSYGTYDMHLTPHYWQDTPRMIQVNQWSVEHETDKAMEFLDRQKDKTESFAMYLSWNPPHSPFEQVPEKYKVMADEMLREMERNGEDISFRQNVDVLDPLLVHTGETVPGGEENLARYRRDYFAAIIGMDEQFGRLMDHLEQHNLMEDTIVVLTADHGELMGSHGMMAKHSWHEESIGVPFAIRWPGQIPSGRTDVVLNTVDIMPTLLGLLELPIPTTVEGESLASLCLGREQLRSLEGGNGEKLAYISAYPGRKVLLEEFEAAGQSNLEFGWRGIRSTRYSYVVDRGYYPLTNPEDPLELQGSVKRMLYDLQEDPYQQNPLLLERASDHPVAEKLEARLREYLKQTADPFVLNPR